MRQIWQKTSKLLGQAKKASEISQIFGHREICNGRQARWVRSDAIAADYKACKRKTSSYLDFVRSELQIVVFASF